MSDGEELKAVIDWRDLLLIVLLCLVIFQTLDLALEWAARRWSIDLLQTRWRRGDLASLLAALGGSWIGFRIADALGFKPVRRPSKLDSGSPLP